MKPENDTSDKARTCPECGKAITRPGSAGSLTAFLFQGSACTCSESPKTGIKLGKEPAASAGDDFCPRCGLVKTNQLRPGSLTGFLFQSTRCRCAGDEQFDSASMSQKFWKLRSENNPAFEGAIKEQQTQLSGRVHVDLVEGTLIAGVYQIVRRIGSGGMGEVYLAKHLTLGKHCALKVIPPEQLREEGWRRFQNEGRVLAKLDHVNLVRVSDLGIHDGCLPFYAMEFVDGQTLSARLAERGKLSSKEAIAIFKQVCDGVDFAHRHGIIHRDIKPANIMIIQSSTSSTLEKITVKVLDFGLAKLVQQDRTKQSLTAVGDVFGSPFYMSPEQCAGEKIDNRADIYSIGCTLFESLTQRPPFEGIYPIAIMYAHQSGQPPTLESVVGRGVFPDDMEVIVAKLLRKNPVERYQTLQELHGDLERLERGEAVKPFYLSRTAQGQSNSAAQLELEGTDAPVYSSPPVFKVRTVIVTVCLLLIAVAAIVLPLSTKLPTTKIVTVFWRDIPNAPHLPHTLAAPRASTAPASINDTAPYASLVEENGKKYRIFNFPTDVSLGELKTKRESKQVHGNTQARGRVKMPFDETLELTPSPMALQYPNYFKRFRPGDIYSINMLPANFIDGQASDTFVDAVSSLPDVEKLKLEACQDLTDKSAAAIDKFHSLKELLLGTNDLDATTVSRLSILPQIELLKMSGHTDVTEVLTRLQSSRCLKTLDIDRAKTSLNGIAGIAKMPKLEKLLLCELVPDNPSVLTQALQILSKSRQLKNFSIERKPLSLRDIKIIASYKNLEVLSIEQVNPCRRDTSYESLKILSQLPKLQRLSIKSFAISPDALQVLKSFKSLEVFDFERGSESAADFRRQMQGVTGLSLEFPSDNQMWVIVRLRPDSAQWRQ